MPSDTVIHKISLNNKCLWMGHIALNTTPCVGHRVFPGCRITCGLSFLLQLFDYLRAKEDFLGNLLSHIGTSAIMDLLMRLVSYDPQYETKSKVLAVGKTNTTAPSGLWGN